MDFLNTRSELQRMNRGNLFKLAMDQRLSKCLVGGITCGLTLQYKGIRFCLSELLGTGCLVERSGQRDQFGSDKEKINSSLTFLREMEAEVLSPGKRPVEFKVYYRDDPTRSMVYLGTVIERRRKERGNNLGDLLKKAVKEYSNDGRDPSKIFLLGY
jgi:hypothetical protein